MSSKYTQPNISSAVRFEKAPLSELEYSRMTVAPRTFTTYNAGDIVPIRCIEVLPHTTINMSIDVINRLLSAMIVPTMGNMQMDIFAFFSSNREVNESWKNVMGENTSGYWTAPEVDLVPLYSLKNTAPVSIPVGSIADYYGLPTQKPIPANVLCNMSDTIFRQYISIYNNYFRAESYQAPISFSKLNVYQGFLEPIGSRINFTGLNDGGAVSLDGPADGSYPAGSLTHAVFGDGASGLSSQIFASKITNFSALDKPFKANKLHDEFTSTLPSPQKGSEVFFGVADSAPVIGSDELHALELPYVFKADNDTFAGLVHNIDINNGGKVSLGAPDNSVFTASEVVTKSNLVTDLSKITGISVNDLRMSAAIQQIYEQLARGGSRYREFLRSFFGLDIENPFKDIPTELGHMRIELDNFQVAQTSASVAGETAQGTLTGFGYTTRRDYLFSYTAIEHGFIHILAVVRQPNLYSTAINPYWFRRTTLDWYYPQLANIGEQPMRLAVLNPFKQDSMEKVIGFQEAWYEYRYESDITTGYCRTGLPESLGSWTYADNFDKDFEVVNGDWLKSNAQEVLDRSLAVTSAVSPQFVACFTFIIEKEIPMPTYSVPGMDII